tara:strand:- start:13 stop:255 length:243 start_codon:yes stop_codon:yes gene_type:complete
MTNSEGPAHEKAESKAKETSEGKEPSEGYAEGGYVNGVYGIRGVSGKPTTLSATQISKMKRGGSPFLLSNEEMLAAGNRK